MVNASPELQENENAWLGDREKVRKWIVHKSRQDVCHNIWSGSPHAGNVMQIEAVCASNSHTAQVKLFPAVRGLHAWGVNSWTNSRIRAIRERFTQPVKGSEPVSVSLSCPERSVEVRQEELGKTRPRFSKERINRAFTKSCILNTSDYIWLYFILFFFISFWKSHQLGKLGAYKWASLWKQAASTNYLSYALWTEVTFICNSTTMKMEGFHLENRLNYFESRKTA